MNTINFSLLNGLPMNQLVLGRLQTAFSIFNSLGAIAGDKSIISGCELVGSTVANGVVFVNNEVFEFRGGSVQSTVIVVEEATNLTFKDNNSYPVVKTRYVTFGTGVNSIPWTDFKRGFPTKNIDSLIQRIVSLEARPTVGNIPIGLIALWDRPFNEIPAGWEEHASMRGRIPVGFKDSDADYDVVGKVGGAKSKTLSIDEIPEHDHTLDNPAVYIGQQVGSGTGQYFEKGNKKTGKTGKGESFSLLNPYRVVHFIKYVGTTP